MYLQYNNIYLTKIVIKQNKCIICNIHNNDQLDDKLVVFVN